MKAEKERDPNQRGALACSLGQHIYQRGALRSSVGMLFVITSLAGGTLAGDENCQSCLT